MRFLPENRRKTILNVILLIAAMAGIVYFNFFLKKPKTAPPPSPENLAEFRGGLLPHGTKINMRILDDPRFKNLKPGPKVGVDPSQLGKTDLFATQ